MLLLRIVCAALLLLQTASALAQCQPGIMQNAPMLSIDATDALNSSGGASYPLSTNYPGNFSCSLPAWWVIGGKNTVTNSSPYSNNDFYLKFPGDAYVKLSVTGIAPAQFNPGTGNNNGSSINSTFLVNLTLLDSAPDKNVMTVTGNMATVSPVMIEQDSTGLTVIQNIARMISDFAYFVFHWSWPVHDYDIYYQPLIIYFTKRETTCSFSDANKTVVLNDIDRASLANGHGDGRTAFRLGFSCAHLQNGASTRGVTAWISSNNLRSGDDSTLISPQSDSAHGVGVRLMKAGEHAPLVIGSSATAQGSATSLFTLAKQQKTKANFYVDMAAWYYVYDASALSAGEVNTTAVVNVAYD
ncbi:fimbrial protein [Erwinia sp. HR93]|uniref:fimbrial protein n=1 Tax=Erwinia sp. HR93 TaxID=3094840 RepID=UPI002ADEC07F|nr:fimbrial protein [Erwinia sp. HR93]MEA1063489.1 fimbrial protein [Erwinia sp. HR93]